MELDVEGWSRVGADALTAPADRVIDGAVVSPEHYEIVFTAPAENGEGGVFNVEITVRQSSRACSSFSAR